MMEKKVKVFRTVALLGEGTYGKVYKVEKLEDGQIYAKKVIKMNEDQ
jgi:serine/threonine protein kinase